MTTKHDSDTSIGLMGMAWRIGLVAMGYLVLLALGGALVEATGTALPQVENAARLLPWILLSGVAIGIVLGPLARRMYGNRLRHVFVWACLLGFNALAVVIEGFFFVPGQISLETVPFLALQQLLASIGTAMLLAVLFARRHDASTAGTTVKRSWYEWLWRVAACVLIYVALFYLVGGLNYALVTRPYYEQQIGLAIPEGPIVLAAETIRGVLIVASILPFILTFQAIRRRLMILAGLALFLVGGVVPLMLQVPTLPGFLLLASAWEIFFQLFPTGVATVALLAK